MTSRQHPQEKIWTSRQLLQWTTGFFEKKEIDSPRVAAEMLLAHVLGVERLKLYMDPDRPTSELERATFKQLVERAGEHEPVDYLVGHTPFFSMMLKVTRDVLIPRPSTETLIEHVVQHARRTPGFHRPLIADVCTGSGAIAIALGKHCKESQLVAMDISEAALEVAKENAAGQHVNENIRFLQGDLYGPLAGQRVKYIVTNPPYISDDEWQEVLPNVKDYEPVLALRGGADGLQFIKPLIEQARQYIDPPGQLVMEIATSQAEIVIELATAAGMSNAQVLADHEGLPRVLVADVE